MSVAVTPSDNLQTLTTANPAGTVFLLSAGTWTLQNVLPKAGNQYIGVGAATILDGQDVATYAFRASAAAPANVVIQGMKIDRYVAATAMGPILAGGDAPSQSTTGWRCTDVEVTRSHNLGIRVGKNMTLTRCNCHHNATLGIGGVGEGLLVDSCTLAYNNVGTTNADSGGCKIVLSPNSIFRNCWVHHNNGVGIWHDIANDGILVEDCLVEDNVQEGIVQEIGMGGIYRRNRVLRSGLDDPRAAGYCWGAGIAIAASGGTGFEIYGNYIEGCAYGIALIQQARGTNHADPTALRADGVGVSPEMYVQNVNVHDNVIVMKSVAGHLNAGSFGTAWAVDDAGGTAIFTSRNNHFSRNRYFTRAADTSPFAWNNGTRSFAYWQATGGHDATGTNIRQLAHFRPGDV